MLWCVADLLHAGESDLMYASLEHIDRSKDNDNDYIIHIMVYGNSIIASEPLNIDSESDLGNDHVAIGRSKTVGGIYRQFETYCYQLYGWLEQRMDWTGAEPRRLGCTK